MPLAYTKFSSFSPGENIRPARPCHSCGPPAPINSHASISLLPVRRKAIIALAPGLLRHPAPQRASAVSEATPQTENSPEIADRRNHARRQIRSLAYVDLGEDNGGLVLNLSEGGMAVHAAVMLAGDQLPRIRFQLPQSPDWMETGGQIAWTGDTKKDIGIQFVGLAEEARNLIREWLSSEEPDYESPEERRRAHQEQKAPAPLAEVPDAPPTILPLGQPRASAMPFLVPKETIPVPAISPIPLAPVQESEPAAVGAEPTARVSTWPRGSVLRISTPIADTKQSVLQRQRRWLPLAAVAVLLAGASFAIGIAAGRVGMTRILTSVRNLITGESESARATSPQSAGETASSPAGLQGNSPTSNNPRGAALQGSAAGRQSANGERASASLVVHRANPPQNATAAGAREDDGSASVLSMPNTPVSATNSVAVSSRLYIPVPAAAGSQRGGHLQIGRLDRRTEIVYPPDAEQQKLEGIVKLHIVIGTDGTVGTVSVVGGPALLASAAIDAVRQWQYKPTMLDGVPIETEEDITVSFRLPEPPPQEK